MKVIVLGGTGFLGSRTVDALRKISGAEVLIAARSGPLVVDVTRPETFDELKGADVIINLTNATQFAPDAVVAWCLKTGLTFIEATSDAVVVERLHKLAQGGNHTGSLILGGGIFTGISNLMGRHCADALKQAQSLEFAVSTSPFSGAGGGTISLMTGSLATPTVSYVDGKRMETALTSGPRVDFMGKQRPSLSASLAEPYMLHESTQVPSVRAFFAPTPGILVTSFTLLPLWLLTSAPFLWFLGLYFTVLRRFLFSTVGTRTELVVNATGADNSKVHVEVLSADGMEGGAFALAAMAEGVAAAPHLPGVSFIDDRVRLEPMVKRANELAGREVLNLTISA